MCYVIYTGAGREKAIQKLIAGVVPSELYTRCFYTYRHMRKKIGGQWADIYEWLIPGYLFVITDRVNEFHAALRELYRCGRYCRLLGNDPVNGFSAVDPSEEQWLRRLIGDRWFDAPLPEPDEPNEPNIPCESAANADPGESATSTAPGTPAAVENSVEPGAPHASTVPVAAAASAGTIAASAYAEPAAPSGIAVAELSTIGFDENDRVQILSGPLMTLSGQVRKLDLHHRRALVEVNFMGKPQLLYLGLEILIRE